MITHRCEASIKVCSIRWHNDDPPYIRRGWYIGFKELDDWGAYRPVSFNKIKYCPFCGEKLYEPM